MALEVQRYITADILAIRLIPDVHPEMAKELELRPGERSLGLVTSTIDDPLYIGGDDATKKADVRVAFCKSHYAGGPYPSGPLSGEALLILAGPDPAEVTAGLNAVMAMVDELIYASVVVKDSELVWLAYTISRAGTYLSAEAGVDAGTPLAYITAPPLEGVYAMERALKAANVTTGVLWGPPTETNYMGALLYGTQSACRAACRAFEEACLSVATDNIAF
jgi:ethanolamine utilization protein EutL